MPPTSMPPELSDSVMETVFKKFEKFLIQHGFLVQNTIKNLSIPQIKTVFHLHFKHEINTETILEFEQLWSFATSKSKVLKQGHIMTFVESDVKAYNLERMDFPQILEKVVLKEQKKKDKLMIMKKARIALDDKRIVMSSVIFPVAYDEKLVENVIETINPGILCCLNTNLADEVKISDVGRKGYVTFKQDVSDIGGMVVYVNHFMGPSLEPKYISKDFESIWINLEMPDLVRFKDVGLAKPKVILGVVREPGMNSREFYQYLLDTIKIVITSRTDFLVFCQVTSQNVNALQSEIIGKCDNQLVSANQRRYLICKKGGIFANVDPILNDGLMKTCPLLLMLCPRRKCLACNEAFLNESAFQDHKLSMRHKRNFYAYFFKEHRQNLIEDKCEVTIENDKSSNEISEYDQDQGIIKVRTRPNIPVNLKLRVFNGASEAAQQYIEIDETKKRKLGIILTSVMTMTNHSGFKITDEYGLYKPKEERDSRVKAGIRIAHQKNYPFSVKCSNPEIGQFRMPVFINFVTESVDGINQTQLYTICREIRLIVTNSDVDHLKPITPFVKPRPVSKREIFTNNVEYGLPLEKEFKNSLPAKWGLDHYPIKERLRKILNKESRSGDIHLVRQNDEATKAFKTVLESGLNNSNYSKRFSLLLHFEEHQMELDIRHYDMERVTMTAQGSKFLKLDVPGLAENRPSVLKGDKIYAQVYHSSNAEKPEAKEYEGYVHQIEDTAVIIGFSPKLRNRFVNNMRFNIRFTFNRFPIRNMHRAAEYVSHNPEMKKLVFPSCSADELLGDVNSTGLAFFDSKIQRNCQQNLAVSSIVQGGIPGIPYIIFGPPGTGKTVTITEAIKQIWKSNNRANIVAAAPSNSAADLLARGLLKSVPKTQILRLYAWSRHEKLIPEDIKAISNFHNSHEDISLNALMRYRIIVVTLITAGKLASAGFPQDHFTHLFIDEAGHAMEPEAVVSLSGVLAKQGGQMVLAGDPKQLGPVLRSSIALKHGLQTSLLERLMSNSDCYKRNPDTNEFPSKTITKLLNNFRSHETLLTLPSRLFYENELKAKADPFVVNSMLNWVNLPNPKIPLVFHGVVGDDQREAKSPSYFNPEECAMVVSYVQDLLEQHKGTGKKILPKEIGIISPYRRQVQKIRMLLEKKKIKDSKDITVGSTEEFQGQERRIIIISTVRSKPTLLQSDYEHKLGFLNNPKRFNVAITRAQALLVVIGNPYLLSMDKWWKELLKYVFVNGCYKGVDYSISEDVDETNGVLDVDRDFRTRFELDEVEKRFKEMFKNVNPSAEDNEDEENFVENLKKFENDISHHEYQESMPWRNDM